MQIKALLRQSRAPETLIILAALWLCAALIRVVLPNSALIVPVAGLVSVLLLLAWAFPARAETVGEYCFRYRWLLALAIFCLCVCLRLHGSSIGIYDEVFPTQILEKETTLFGIPRWIRSDEFGLTTPTYFSQAANGYRLYSQQMSLSPTNMVLDFYSPVWDWTILGKPMAWGFLFFGNEVGLSWYWCMEIILLFMTAFEMCLILTGRRLTAFLGAVMIALSPAIQWWVMPHMPPVILYAMALFDIGYWFFTAKGRLAKWCGAALAMIAAVGFALSVFPSFQVPCAYTLLILLVVCLCRDREIITFSARDWPRLALPALGAMLILGRFLLLSREDLSLLMNTVYPGRRVDLGGNRGIYDLFSDFSSLFLPYKDITYANNCEVATYIHFAPFFLALSPRLFADMKKGGDRHLVPGKALFWIIVAEAVYMLVGIPEWLAEITLLRFCNRMHEVYGWTATLFTVWGFAALYRYPDCLSRREKLLWPAAYGALWLLFVKDGLRGYFLQFSFAGYEIGRLLPPLVALGFSLLLLLTLWQRQKLVTSLLILIMLFCGGTVNPIERGTGAVTNHPISAAISDISQHEPESRWMSSDNVFFFADFVMANGAKVLNAINFYPDLEKWAIIDPNGTYEEASNRYVNQGVVLTGETDSVELVSPDQIRLYLNPESLKRLEIRYLFTPVDHTEFLEKHGIACEYVAGQDGHGIWRLSYEEM